MQPAVLPSRRLFLALFFSTVLFIGLTLACAAIAFLDSSAWGAASQPVVIPAPTAEGAPAGQAASLPLSSTRLSSAPILTPTPDPPHPLPTLRVEPEEYTVQPGDTLNQIAQRYLVSLNDLIQANDLASPDLLEIGQLLTIPVPTPEGSGPAFKIIPDSELVYGPASVNFDVREFVEASGGYLSEYSEEVYDQKLAGADIVELIAQEFSVNPRLLLAVLEYQSGWVTQKQPEKETLDYPIGLYVDWRAGLYQQLAWAANSLNRGYYLWRIHGIGAWNLADGYLLPIDPTINAGTAAVQHFFSQVLEREDWNRAVSESGLFATYNQLFGYPFDLAIEPLLPDDLVQPAMQLPFQEGEVWAFTGGPHGGWGDGSAWAALDFAPPGEPLGCVQSDAWIVAIADGVVVRTGNGAVVQDLDGDGFEQTGWSVLYMHIESRDRVRPGTYLEAGDRVGHPSCEGGFSSGTHVHLARRYNGEWISADRLIPFVLDGWVSEGAGREYDGFLKRDGQTVEAWEGQNPENAIQR